MVQAQTIQSNKTFTNIRNFTLVGSLDKVLINKKKSTCNLVGLAVPADNRMKIEESKKRDEFFDLDRRLKKPWNIKVLVIPIVIDVLGTITKSLEKRLDECKLENIQTKELSRFFKMFKIVLETL